MSRTRRKGTFSRWNEPVLSLTDVKRQHYVPRFYLSAFADLKGQISVVDLEPPGCQYKANVSDTAVVKGFYDFAIEGLTVSIETWLSELEGAAAPVLGRLIDDPDALLRLSFEDEVVLARFLAAFRFRTPAFRDQTLAMQKFLVSKMKEFATAFAHKKYHAAEVEEVLKVWQEKPDEWWLSDSPPESPAQLTAHMLSDVQGYANLLRSMPWRIGQVPVEQPLYTSDNPLAGRLPPVRESWRTEAFASLRYYVPLSPNTLLQVDPLPKRLEDEAPNPRGTRRRRDFNHWQARYALMTVASRARRYIFGTTSAVSHEEAIRWLQYDDEMTRAWAMRYLGYDPRPPRIGKGLNRLRTS